MNNSECHVNDKAGDADLMRLGKVLSERNEKAKSMPYNFSPAKYAFFYCDPPRPSLDHFNRNSRNDRANFTRTDVLLSPKYKGKMNLFTSNFDEYETQLAKIDSVLIKSDESLEEEPKNPSQKTVSSLDAMKFYEASSDESNQSILTLISPSHQRPHVKLDRNSVISVSSDSKLELSKHSKQNSGALSRSYEDMRCERRRDFDEDLKFDTIPVSNLTHKPTLSFSKKLNLVSQCDKKEKFTTDDISNNIKLNNKPHKHKQRIKNAESNIKNDHIDSSFDDYNDVDEKELSNFVQEINEQNLGEIKHNSLIGSDDDDDNDDGDDDYEFKNNHLDHDFFNRLSSLPNSVYSDQNKHFSELAFAEVRINDSSHHHHYHQPTPLFQNPHHLSNQHHRPPNHYHLSNQHHPLNTNYQLEHQISTDPTASPKSPTESQGTIDTFPQEPLASDSLLEQLKRSVMQRCVKETDRPSAARLAKRLYFLQGFKKSDVPRHLSKRFVGVCELMGVCDLVSVWG